MNYHQVRIFDDVEPLELVDVFGCDLEWGELITFSETFAGRSRYDPWVGLLHEVKTSSLLVSTKEGSALSGGLYEFSKIRIRNLKRESE